MDRSSLDAQYTPSGWQWRFHSVEADEVLGAGAAGPGKSEALLMDPILNQLLIEHARMTQSQHALSLLDEPWRSLAKRHPIAPGKSKGWAIYLRRELVRVREMIIRSQRIFPLIDPGAHYNSQDLLWTFSCGYHYEFGHCQNVSDWMRYSGREFTSEGFDELIEFEEEQYEEIGYRLRTDDPVLMYRLLRKSASNPVQALDERHIAVSNPHWVRDRFVKPCREGNKLLRTKAINKDGEEREVTRIFLPATLYDHPNPNYIKQYEKRLLFAKPHIRNALLYGSWWEGGIGAYFGDDWNPRLHVIEPFKIPDSWPQFRVMDWGFKTPGYVGWFAMDDDENLIQTRELVFQDKSDEEVADLVKGIEIGLGVWNEGEECSELTGPADTQLWEERGEKGLTKAMAFARKGVRWVKAAKGPGSRVSGAERLSKRLRDHRNGTTLPGFMVFRTCNKMIETLPEIQKDPKDPNRPADGGYDHPFDVARYACDYASRGKIGVTLLSHRQETHDPIFGQPKRRKGRNIAKGYNGYGG